MRGFIGGTSGWPSSAVVPEGGYTGAVSVLPIRAHLQALAIFAGIALLICYPVLGDPVHLALGAPGNDIWNHLWGYWWVHKEIFVEGKIPLSTDLLAWPGGGSLWFIDSFDVILTLPVQAVAGPVAAYNAGILLNLCGCGVGAYVLGYRVSQSWAGAVVAGVAYMTTPHLLGQIYNGISETVAAGWLPLAVMALREVMAEPTAKRGAIAGFFVGLTTLASWYYGLFAGLVWLGLLLRFLLSLLRRRGKERPPFSAFLRAGFFGAVVILLLTALPFYWFSASMSAEDALVTRDPGFVWMTLVMHNMTDLLTLVHPGKFYSPDLHAAFGEDLLVIVYMGASLWIPAFWLLFVQRQKIALRHRAEPWFLLWIFFGVLSLGPFLYVAGNYVQVKGGWIPLPFLALYQWFPMFSRISHAYRFAMGVALALSVLVALSVRASRYPGRIAFFIGCMRIAESLLGSPAVWPLPVSALQIPAIYGQLNGGAVLDLPITEPVLARSRTLIYQLVHQQPIPFGLNDPVPPYLYNNHYTHFLMELERRNIQQLPENLPMLDLVAGQKDFLLTGGRWIVVHRDRYTPEQAARIIRFLDWTASFYGEEGEIRVYEIRESEGADRPDL